jgi:hypothetical protein
MTITQTIREVVLEMNTEIPVVDAEGISQRNRMPHTWSTTAVLSSIQHQRQVIGILMQVFGSC